MSNKQLVWAVVVLALAIILAAIINAVLIKSPGQSALQQDLQLQSPTEAAAATADHPTIPENAKRGDAIPNFYVVSLNEGYTSSTVITRHGFAPHAVYKKVLNGFASYIPPGRLAALQSDPAVKLVEADTIYTAEQSFEALAKPEFCGDLGPEPGTVEIFPVVDKSSSPDKIETARLSCSKDSLSDWVGLKSGISYTSSTSGKCSHLGFRFTLDGDQDSCKQRGGDAPSDTTVETAVPPGGTVSTGDTAEPWDPVETSLTTPVGGDVTIKEQPITIPDPTGFELIGQQINISADRSPESPLIMTFRYDKSLFEPTDVNIAMFDFNGTQSVLIPVCDLSLPPGDACVAGRVTLADGDQQFTIHATENGIKAMGIAGSRTKFTPSQTTPVGIKRVNGGDEAVEGFCRAWVLDTGIDFDHPDLNVDTFKSKSFIIRTTGEDDNGHGTAVAGIIAAIDNEIGVIGVAPGAPVVAVKVLDKNGAGSFSGVIP